MNTQKIKNLLKDPKTNWKYIAVVAILAFIAGAIIMNYLSKTKTGFEIPQITLLERKDTIAKRFVGTVKTGAQLGDRRQEYCPNGQYLVADEGLYLINQIKTLQLRFPNDPDWANKEYVGKKVEVIGRYPAQENFCEALLCECEDYILVENIYIVISY